MRDTLKLAVVSSLVGLFLFTQTSCLKTRSQLKNNDNSDAADAQAGDGGSDDGGKATKSPHYDLEEMKNEMTRIAGKLDQIDYNTKANNVSELKDTVASLNNRVTDIEKNQLLIMTELKALKDKEADEAKLSGVSTKSLLLDGNKLLAAKKYDEAAEKFRGVLSKSPKGKDAAEAHFGLGEVEYAQKNYKKAIVEYSKVQDTYAQSTEVPPSLYRIGLSFTRLNMQKEARGFFSEVVERYPKSPEAKKARGRLKDSDSAGT